HRAAARDPPAGRRGLRRARQGASLRARAARATAQRTPLGDGSPGAGQAAAAGARARARRGRHGGPRQPLRDRGRSPAARRGARQHGAAAWLRPAAGAAALPRDLRHARGGHRRLPDVPRPRQARRHGRAQDRRHVRERDRDARRALGGLRLLLRTLQGYRQGRRGRRLRRQGGGPRALRRARPEGPRAPSRCPRRVGRPRHALGARGPRLAAGAGAPVEPLLWRRFRHRVHRAGVRPFLGPLSPLVSDAIRSNEPVAGFQNVAGRLTWVHVVPVQQDERAAGAAAVLLDAQYLDSGEWDLWRRTAVRMGVLMLLVTGITWALVRWSVTRPIARIAEWTKQMKAGRPVAPPPDADESLFGSLASEVTGLARTLARARSAAEQEARLRLVGESVWTEERLKQFVEMR